MKVSYNWLQTYFDKPIPPADALAELFTFHSFEVEGIERLRDATHRVIDTVIDAKVLPDRAHYCLSHKGIAEEISVLTKMSLKKGKAAAEIPASMDGKPEIKITDPHFCHRYIGRYVEHISLIPPQSQSPAWVKGFLEAIGQRSINSIVDATNMIMFDVGQPLHAFDADKVEGSIVVRAAKAGEKITLLDSSEGPGKEIELLPSDHVIADDVGPLAIAGVKGGKRAGVTAATTRLILESANFESIAVRRTATRYDLRSESSKRYENEITPELARLGMNNLCALIKEIHPNAVFGPMVDQYPVKAVKTVISFDPVCIEERLGLRMPIAPAKDILERMSIAIIEDGGKWRLTIPFYRLDLAIPEDITEEIGRIYGYGHIQGILPPVLKEKVSVLPMFYLSEKIKNILVGQGFSEVSLYTLVSKGEVETAYPLAKDKSFARANLTDGIMACVERNALNADLLGLDVIKVFEVGRVFSKEGESTRLSLGVAQVKKMKEEKGDSILVTSIESLNKELGLSISSPKIITKGIHAACEISLDEVLKSYKVPADASYSDLHFDSASPNMYRKISPYPFIVRDIAVFVPESVQADDVWQTIEKGISNAAAAELLARHSLFDTFKKDGKVSYAFRMVFQSMEKTLTDDEANKIMENIYAEMKDKSWEVR